MVDDGGEGVGERAQVGWGGGEGGAEDDGVDVLRVVRLLILFYFEWVVGVW